MKVKLVSALALVGLGIAMATSATAQSPFAVRLGGYATTDYRSRAVADDNGLVIGAQYTFLGVPAGENAGGWSTTLAVEYHTQFTSKSGRFQGVPVSISHVYTFEEQDGKRAYAGFCVTAMTFKTTRIIPEQPWRTRYGGGLVLGVNFGDKWFLEGRFEKFRRERSWGVPDGFRATLGYRF